MKLQTALVALLGAACVGAWADPENDRIASERAAANAKLAEREKACNQQFVVSGCLDDARKENRATLARLRHEEIRLDEARRHAAADARRKEIAERAQAQAARASEAPPAEPEVRVRRPPSVPNAPTQRHRPEPSPLHFPGVPASGGSRAEAEQRNVEKFNENAAAVQAHREAVEKRNAERAAQGKIAAPLPVPSGASGAR